MSATGVLQSFPAHATPVSQNGVNRLRGVINLDYMELTVNFIGAQSNAILSADIFNQIRCTVVRTGLPYSGAPEQAQVSVVGGLQLSDVKEVYHDQVATLTTRAWNSSSGYNSPGVIIKRKTIPIGYRLAVHSENTTGVGVAWDTLMSDVLISFVSDSNVTPHPQIQFNCRVFYRWMSG